mgnify:FL=1
MSFKNKMQFERGELITESDLKSFFNCKYSYFLRKNLGTSKAPVSAFASMALFFQQERKKIFQMIRDKTLRDPERMDMNELNENFPFRDAYAWSGWLQGRWNHAIKGEKFHGREIRWAFNGQGYRSGQNLKDAVVNYWSFVLENGAPILGTINLPMSVYFEGIPLKVKFPEIRRGGIIDDPNPWGFRTDFDRKDGTIDESAFVTFRILALCEILRNGMKEDNYFLFEKLGIDDDVINDLETMIISPKIKYRHYNAKKDILLETNRDDSHLDKLRNKFEEFFEGRLRRDFPVNHGHCGSCQYNVLGNDGKAICPSIKKGTRLLVPEVYFKKRKFRININKSEGEIYLLGKVREDEFVDREIAEYSLSYVIGSEIVAQSSYDCSLRGMGYEEKMIERGYRELKFIAEVQSKVLKHEVDFKDFDFAGKKKIKKKLLDLGYDEIDKDTFLLSYDPLPF